MSQLTIRFYTSAILLLIIALAFNYLPVMFISLIVICTLSLNEFNNLFRKIYKKKKLLYLVSIIISLFYLLFFSLTISNYIFLFDNSLKISLIFLILICTLTDIGGYFFGKIFGGKKFTKISPNKTYSGIVGSFIFSIIFGYVFYYYFSQQIYIKVNVIIFICIISIISQIGDLIISYFKRKAHIKDTGSILPGHGGILDRIDGIMIALPVGIILLSL